MPRRSEFFGNRSFGFRLRGFGPRAHRAQYVLGTADGPRGPVHPTAEGMVLGTPRYLTPEHLGVSPVDQRTDIYGVGLLLYVMLTGRGPFDGEKGMAGFARAAAYDIPAPPSSVAPVPAGLEAIVMRCLEKQKEARYDSAEALIAEAGRRGSRCARKSPSDL